MLVARINRGYIDRMANPPIQPIAALVPSAAEYLRSIVTPAIKRSIENPADASLAVSAFTVLYHTKDWAKRDGTIVDEAAYWAACSFAQMTAEIANGGKHMEVKDQRFTSDPAALEFRLCGYGEGGYGVGPYGVANIQIKGHKVPGDTERFYSIAEVLSEVQAWWQSTLGL